MVESGHSCFSLKRDLWGVISASCCFRTFFRPGSGAGSASSHLTCFLSLHPPPPNKAAAVLFSKMPGCSAISSQTDVESSSNLHPRAEESGLTPESGGVIRHMIRVFALWGSVSTLG